MAAIIRRLSSARALLNWLKTVDGSGSGLDADTVDGLHASSFALTTAVREKLTANRTYYVRDDGSDSNDGLTNSPSGSFLTLQHAVNVVAALDRSIYNVTIQVMDGTYTAGAVIQNMDGVGSGTITIKGNTASPGNVLINATGTAFSVIGTRITIQDMEIRSSAGSGIISQYGAYVTFSNLRFGAITSIQLYALAAAIVAAGNYSIVGSAGYHWYAENSGIIRVTGRTITLTGTPAFSVFAVAATVASMTVFTNTFSGSATGQRYLAFLNGVISVNAAGATYLPGNVGGGTATGGQYA